MNAREYLIDMCDTVATSLSLQYAKKSPEMLQHWIEDDIGNQPFISMVRIVSNGAEGSLITFNVDFVSVVTLGYDFTPEEREQAENDAETQAMNFIYVMKEQHAITVDWNLSEIFRHETFEGLGKAMSLTVTLLDSQNYCALVLP